MTEVSHYYLSCRIGREWYGINLDSVIEVMHFLALTELPGDNPHVLGLMAVRDMVMPVVDLRRQFGLSEAPLHLDTPIVATHTSQGPVGLVVDDADDIVTVDASQWTSYSADSPYIAGVAKLPEHLLLLLNLDALMPEIQMPHALKSNGSKEAAHAPIEAVHAKG